MSAPSLPERPLVGSDGDTSSTPCLAPVLSLVVPMFREAARIGPTVETLARSALNRPGVEFVFVDDGSPDGTAAATAAAISTFGLLGARVVALQANQGKGGAVRAGVLRATGDVVGFVDADLSLDPAEVDRALALLIGSESAVVVGHRIVDPRRQPVLRRIASLAFRAVTALVAPTGVTDSQCALKLFRRDAAAALFGPLVTDGFGFDVELLRARRLGLRVQELAVAWQHQEGSKVDPVRDGIRMLGDVARARSRAGVSRTRPVPAARELSPLAPGARFPVPSDLTARAARRVPAG